jgi:hypothetical protein
MHGGYTPTRFLVGTCPRKGMYQMNWLVVKRENGVMLFASGIKVSL